MQALGVFHIGQAVTEKAGQTFKGAHPVFALKPGFLNSGHRGGGNLDFVGGQGLYLQLGPTAHKPVKLAGVSVYRQRTDQRQNKLPYGAHSFGASRIAPCCPGEVGVPGLRYHGSVHPDGLVLAVPESGVVHLRPADAGRFNNLVRVEVGVVVVQIVEVNLDDPAAVNRGLVIVLHGVVS